MVTKLCEICNQPYEVKPYRKDKARFCSQVCGGRWHMSVRKMPNDHKYGNQYRKGLRPTNAFTSEQARQMNKVDSLPFECTNCSKSFELKPWVVRQNPSSSGNRFCSKKCHGLYMKEKQSGKNSPLWVGGNQTYRGRNWKEIRKLAVERDNGTCQDCNTYIGSSIPVHHINPYRNKESVETINQINNLICLCQSCHMKRERVSS